MSNRPSPRLARLGELARDHLARRGGNFELNIAVRGKAGEDFGTVLLTVLDRLS
jgi:hypothetical protein